MASHSVVISRSENWWQRWIARLSRDLGAWLYVALVLGMVSALAFVYLAQASYVARQIEEMARLEVELYRLKEGNSALLVAIAEYEDASRIKSEARAMGLGPAAKVEYVEVEVDEAGSQPQGGALERTLAHPEDGSQVPSASNQFPLSLGGLGLTPDIARQFQGWIGSGTSTRDAD